MLESTFKINKEQSQQFARAIFTDIEKYIVEHQAEFEEFLREEEKSFTEEK